MQRSLCIACLFLIPLPLCACHKEPDFDARFDEAQNKIDEKAADMDKDLKGPDAADSAPDQ